jgi:methylthioribulose-1-phosphate dehydratase
VPQEVAEALVDLAHRAYARGWTLGTSGNFSAVISREPLRLAVTASGIDKGRLSPEDVVEVDGTGAPVRGGGRPSAETPLHLAVVLERGAGAVAHTHSVWSTLLSDAHAADGGLAVEGYEMLKGLRGVETHQHREWLPIFENTQDWVAGSAAVREELRRHPGAHGFLIRRHGLYTWGKDVAEALRHTEALEFLLEAVGRGVALRVGARSHT